MALSRSNKQKLLDKMRQNKAKKGGGKRDPTEWRPKFKEGEDITYKVYILPPLEEGDVCLDKDGQESTCEESWDLWYFQHGFHYVNKERHECPRIRSIGDCPVCSTGFDLMRDVEDKDSRRAIAKEWLSQESHVVNIYFTDEKINPEDLRGKVFWWRLPNAIFRQCEAAVDRDDAGDDKADLQPFGLFFYPEDSFPVKIVLREKSAYNNYDDSKLLAISSPIADGDDKMEAILNKRVDYPTKIDAPVMGNLEKIVENKLSDDSDEPSSDNKSGGFDDDQNVKSESKSDDVDDEKAAAKKAKAEEMRKKIADKKAKEAAAEEPAEEADKEEPAEAEAKSDDDDGEIDEDVAALLAELG